LKDNFKPIIASLVDSRVIVWNIESAKKLYKNGFYGKPIGIRKPRDTSFEVPLELSLFEALYLLEKNVIRIVDENNEEIDREKLLEIARSNYHLFDDMYRIYRNLREKGYVVRPGMKFGADFAVYKFGPGIDHAPFLVEVIPMNSKLDPIEIVRAGRLSHSVKKKFIIATINPVTKEVIYYMFKWFKA